MSETTPLATGFPGSRSLVRIHSTRIEKKSGQTSEENRYYLSSQEPSERTPAGWIDLSRAHWAGVENRNHWRRDATLGEDRTRLHQSRALINLALLRSINLRLLASEPDEDWLPAKTERFAAHPTSAIALLRKRL